jgi:PIN domain nuclease of toxin-antitoxin system
VIPVLDTHIWLWWLLKDRRLDQKIFKRLNRLAAAKTPPLLADISVWESTMLYQARRIELNLPYETFIGLATQNDVVQLMPIHAKVAGELLRLPDWFHKDPADRLIVATALAMGVPLCTVDERIINSKIVKIYQ